MDVTEIFCNVIWSENLKAIPMHST